MDVIAFSRKSVNHTSGLSILKHGVISLPGAIHVINSVISIEMIPKIERTFNASHQNKDQT